MNDLQKAVVDWARSQLRTYFDDEQLEVLSDFAEPTYLGCWRADPFRGLTCRERWAEVNKPDRPVVALEMSCTICGHLLIIPAVPLDEVSFSLEHLHPTTVHAITSEPLCSEECVEIFSREVARGG